MFPAAIARSPIVPLFAEPSLRAEQVSQLILGETASVLQSNAEWRRLRSSLDGYEGWAHAGYILEVDEGIADRWRSDAGGWSLGAVVRMGENPIRIPLRARVAIDGMTVRLPDGRRGQLVEGLVPTETDALASARGMAPQRWALQHFSGSLVRMGWRDAMGSGLLGAGADDLRGTRDQAAARLLATDRMRRGSLGRAPEARRSSLFPR